MIVNNYILYKGAWVSNNAPHVTVKLTKKELAFMLSKGGLFVRNTYDFDLDYPTPFWFVIKDSFEGMTELSSKVRNQVKRAKSRLDIKLITKEILLSDGFEVSVAAHKSYKMKSNPPSKNEFTEMITNCDEHYNFWGCFDKETNKLIAYSINKIYDDQCDYQTLKALPEYLKLYYPYYGLIYEMNDYYLNVLKLKYVNDGSRTITEHSNIQSFLIDKFNFRKAYTLMQIKYVWWLNVLIAVLFPFRVIIPIRILKSLFVLEEINRCFKKK